MRQNSRFFPPFDVGMRVAPYKRGETPERTVFIDFTPTHGPPPARIERELEINFHKRSSPVPSTTWQRRRLDYSEFLHPRVASTSSSDHSYEYTYEYVSDDPTECECSYNRSESEETDYDNDYDYDYDYDRPKTCWSLKFLSDADLTDVSLDGDSDASPLNLSNPVNFDWPRDDDLALSDLD